MPLQSFVHHFISLRIDIWSRSHFLRKAHEQPYWFETKNEVLMGKLKASRASCFTWNRNGFSPLLQDCEEKILSLTFLIKSISGRNHRLGQSVSTKNQAEGHGCLVAGRLQQRLFKHQQGHLDRVPLHEWALWERGLCLHLRGRRRKGQQLPGTQVSK